MDYFALAAAILALVVGIAAIFAGFGLQRRLNALELPDKEKQADAVAQEARYQTLDARLSTLEKRPEAPAMEQYRQVLIEIEKWAHEVREMGHRFEEMAGSLKRTQAQQAARSRRAAKPEPEPEEEEEPEFQPAQSSFMPQLATNGHAPAAPGRRFGKLT